jgi:hypothetical protein
LGHGDLVWPLLLVALVAAGDLRAEGGAARRKPVTKVTVFPGMEEEAPTDTPTGQRWARGGEFVEQFGQEVGAVGFYGIAEGAAGESESEK